MRKMGIRTVMITGDNPLTAKAIADEAGVDDFLAEATPEDKLALIKREQEGGRLVAMTGDGPNDAPGVGQSVVDHARRVECLLDRQRHRQILCHHPGDVRRTVPRTGSAQRDETAQST